jgi:Inositol 1,4,5-trisphosphate/ryanodine receptor
MTELACICFGDSIGLVNGLFTLGSPSLHDEPITERSIQVSGLRAVRNDFSVSTTGFQLPSDYADRCIFKIIPDKNASVDNRSVDNVCFGSVVRLIHEPTGHSLVASSIDHKQPGVTVQGIMKCVYLCNEMTREEEAASHWLIQSRYKLRREGDFVRVNDSVILKSVYYKDFFLTIPEVPTVEGDAKDAKNKVLPGPQYVGMTTSASRVAASGWLVKCFLSDQTKVSPNSRQNSGLESSTPPNGSIAGLGSSDENDKEDENVVSTGMYVRIAHIESKGHMVCRADDSKAVLSKIAPLGAIYRIQSGVRTETHGVYMRCSASSNSSSEASVANTNDSMNVWQILPQSTDGLDVFGKV